MACGVVRHGHAQHQGRRSGHLGTVSPVPNANGDLRASSSNGVPFAATIYNTPLNFADNLKADLGIYAQDSWTMKRLTVNYGARWEYFASGIPA